MFHAKTGLSMTLWFYASFLFSLVILCGNSLCNLLHLSQWAVWRVEKPQADNLEADEKSIYCWLVLKKHKVFWSFDALQTQDQKTLEIHYHQHTAMLTIQQWTEEWQDYLYTRWWGNEHRMVNKTQLNNNQLVKGQEKHKEHLWT